MTDLSKNIQALREKKAVVEMGGGEAAIEKQIAMGKLTARDRILSLSNKDRILSRTGHIHGKNSILVGQEFFP